jgi:hypothetical protein
VRFLIVDPAKQEVRVVNAPDAHDAHPDLYKRGVDFGTVFSGLGLYVYEYGLVDLQPPYFALNGGLYSGDAVLFAYDHTGETVSMPEVKIEPAKGATVVTGLEHPLVINWLPTPADAEIAIDSRVCARPEVAVSPRNGERTVLWRWPSPGYRP